MHKILVRAQDSCACTAITSKINVFCQNTFFTNGLRRSSDRGNSSRGDARLFYFHGFSEEIGFPARGHFMIFRTFFEIFDEK